MKKRIGITMRVVYSPDSGEERDAISRDLLSYTNKTLPGYEIVLIPNSPYRIADKLKSLKVNGVILSGGNDWGKAPNRDKTESCIVKYCLKHNVPLLGICRGMQVMNLVTGGRLNKNIRTSSGENHVACTHTVNIWPDSPINIKGIGRSIKVNSFHDQGLTAADISKEFKVFAVTDGGVVEGIFHKTKPVIGIQWHPERKNSCAMLDRRIIEALFK